ncbi:MAG: ribonuclease H-like domain-containing protein [Acidobacteria bacterium]|nr:ribonuclease H-like domain-containing protein [Acidobacteriota bacterium]
MGVLERAWPSARGVGRSTAPALAFLDLETTGIAGGAGTQAFLVGCASIDGRGLRVQQFLLPAFEHERALLAEVSGWARTPQTLVTFNGRTFDVPLIETRYLYHRLSFPLGDTPHLDMLHPARRLWRARPAIAAPPLDPFGRLRVDGERRRTVDEECCRLSVLERHLAGVLRVGDVPGFEIPSRYFRFVRDGDARPLEVVLERVVPPHCDERRAKRWRFISNTAFAI